MAARATLFKRRAKKMKPETNDELLNRILSELDARKTEGLTMFSRAQAEIADESYGRYAVLQKANVVGATPAMGYSRGPQWTVDPTGKERPLGFSVDEMDPTGEPHEVANSLRQFAAEEPDRGPVWSPEGEE
jgi:hypothetical protein